MRLSNSSSEASIPGRRTPDQHGDPFDRLLIAQARMEGLTIVTSDAAFGDYDVKLLDARA
jgi:PIN domain nuclease of toxin-antitoxin system